MKFKMFFTGLLMSVLLIAGCNTTGGASTVPAYTTEIGIACSAVSAAQKAIAIKNNVKPFTKTEQDQITAASNAVLPVCGADSPPTLTSVAYQAFLQSVVLLQGKAK